MSPQTVMVGPRRVPHRASPGRAGAPAIPRGHVQLYCADPPRNLVLPLGPEPVKFSAAGGGWEVLPRPGQTGATLWQGGEPFALQVPLMLDNLARHKSVERAMRALDRIAHGDRDGDGPGLVELGGIPTPVDEWFVESVDYGDPIRRVSDLAVLRQPLTLTLREHVPPGYVQLRRRRYSPAAKRKTGPMKAKQGDTVTTLARRRNVPWTELRKLNPGVVWAANQKLRAGQVIYAPPPGFRPAKHDRHRDMGGPG